MSDEVPGDGVDFDIQPILGLPISILQAVMMGYQQKLEDIDINQNHWFSSTIYLVPPQYAQPK